MWRASEALPAPQGQRCRDPRGAATRGPSPSRQATGPTHCGVVCFQDPSSPLLMGLTGSTSRACLEGVLKAPLGFTWVWIAPHPIYTSGTTTGPLSMVPWPRSLSARSLRQRSAPAGTVYAVLLARYHCPVRASFLHLFTAKLLDFISNRSYTAYFSYIWCCLFVKLVRTWLKRSLGRQQMGRTSAGTL